MTQETSHGNESQSAPQAAHPYHQAEPTIPTPASGLQPTAQQVAHPAQGGNPSPPANQWGQSVSPAQGEQYGNPSFWQAPAQGSQGGQAVTEQAQEEDVVEQEAGEYDSYVDNFNDPVSKGLMQGIEALANTHGVDLVQAFGPAYESGNTDFINHAYLQSVAPELADVLAQQASALIHHEKQASQATVQSVYQMAGGQEQWGQAAKQFNEGAPEEVKHVIRNLLDSNDKANLQYAVNAVLQYAQGTGQVPYQQGSRVSPNQTQGTSFSQPMTKSAFQEAERALAAQHTHGSREYNEQFQYLVQQRQQAMQRGI